ncbi:hypothetical protein BofuT4_P055490.1 [Botrytis cinerea T4]|uniref:Uncharacterized protein n=1 Tax=Botryotinia fuckeliana (strain T4) TaxID=999810 RepID=G2XVX8_BOTF4|nr:hypothetical protein BofuT4_P055490.1 [Botrytis cinerea T4]
MHITAARSLTLLGVFAYSSTASAWPQTSISPQNALECNLAAEPTLSPIPSDTSLSMIAISQHINTDTEPEDAHHARNLGPFGQEGFNIATYRTGAPTDAEVVATSPIPTPVPSITARIPYSDYYYYCSCVDNLLHCRYGYYYCAGCGCVGNGFGFGSCTAEWSAADFPNDYEIVCEYDFGCGDGESGAGV